VEIYKIVLTAVLTITGGVVVFALSQLIQRFFLEPVHEQAKAIGEVLFGLMYYASRYASPGSGKLDDLSAVSDAIRRSASQLYATTNAIRWYRLFDKLRLVPIRQNVDEAVGDLIRLSNSIHTGNGRENRADADHIRSLLAVRKR
jgi:hypothetical protein